ncbi:MAG: hypothetical protein K5675_03540 [Lachnospiraceae bacterium]|nr:hypothetical protein [Lachnospiraceae bacterium]
MKIGIIFICIVIVSTYIIIIDRYIESVIEVYKDNETPEEKIFSKWYQKEVNPHRKPLYVEYESYKKTISYKKYYARYRRKEISLARLEVKNMLRETIKNYFAKESTKGSSSRKK